MKNNGYSLKWINVYIMSKSRSVTRGKLNSPAGYALHVHPSVNYTFIKYELNSSNNGATLIQIYVIKVTFFNLLISSHNVHVSIMIYYMQQFTGHLVNVFSILHWIIW